MAVDLTKAPCYGVRCKTRDGYHIVAVDKIQRRQTRGYWAPATWSKEITADELAHTDYESWWTVEDSGYEPGFQLNKQGTETSLASYDLVMCLVSELDEPEVNEWGEVCP